MKMFKSIILIALIFVSCSKSDSGSGSEETPEQNAAPSKVGSLVYPTNNLLCITNVLDFEWNKATDPDGDSVSYELEVSKTNDFSSENLNYEVNTTTTSVTLEKETAYYWRVKAVDSKDLSSDYSEIYQFYTEGIGQTNHVPFAPQLIAPEIDATITESTTKLEWSCSDVDNDTLLYDVYLDLNNPPTTKIGDNISLQILDTALSPSSTYYWKIVAKDTNGSQSIGQVWSFTTN